MLCLCCRLDTGLAEGSSTSSGHGSQHPGLIIPAHSGSAAAHAAGASGALECGWSCLRSVQELILDGICLDSTLMAATLDCQQLTALRVGALELRQDVRAVAVAGNGAGFRGLQRLRVLQVDQHFSLGCNDAAVLMPALESLQVTHAGGRRWVNQCMVVAVCAAQLLVTSIIFVLGQVCWEGQALCGKDRCG